MKSLNAEKRHFGVLSYFILTFIALFFLFLQFSTSEAYELVKTEKKTFDLRVGANLILNVDIGNIELITWEENKVFIEMRKWVDAGNENQAEKKMQKLEVDFISDNDQLIINQLNRNTKNFFSKILNKTGLKNSSSSGIDFMLKVPTHLFLIIELKKGEVKIDSLQGSVEINQEEGELHLNEIKLDKLDLQLGNVKTKIQQLKGNNSPETNMVVSCEKGNFILLDSFIGKLVARMNETNSYLVGDKISDCDLKSEEGDIFIRPLNLKESKYKTFSERGDIHLLVSEQLPCSITLDTGLGKIQSPYVWDIKKRGSGHYFKLDKAGSNNGKLEIITELGDIFIEDKWGDG